MSEWAKNSKYEQIWAKFKTKQCAQNQQQVDHRGSCPLSRTLPIACATKLPPEILGSSYWSCGKMIVSRGNTALWLPKEAHLGFGSSSSTPVDTWPGTAPNTSIGGRTLWKYVENMWNLNSNTKILKCIDRILMILWILAMPITFAQGMPRPKRSIRAQSARNWAPGEVSFP